MADPTGARSFDDPTVVPIGTRGRPGRGSRRTRPSSASRSLAGPPPDAGARSDDPGPTGDRVFARRGGDKSGPGTDRAGSETPDGPTATAGASGDDTWSTPSQFPVSDWLVAAIEAVRDALDSGWKNGDWEQTTAQLVAQLRRRLAGEYEVDEFGMDPQIQQILLSGLRPLARDWFRMEVRGAENVPPEGGALIVANHSGTVPVDAAMTGLAVHDEADRTLRLLGADLVFQLPFVGELARKSGATLACTEDAERLLRTGHVVGVWPEGFKGIGKPYTERYKLQRFGRGGFVAAAMRAGVPIVPVSIVGAEEIYPLIGNMPSLARLLGLPYLPITPFFPWLGPVGMIPLPSKWIIEFGEPIRTDAYSEDAADDPMLVFNLTDQVRETIQQTLYALLVDRGHPFR